MLSARKARASGPGNRAVEALMDNPNTASLRPQLSAAERAAMSDTRPMRPIDYG